MPVTDVDAAPARSRSAQLRGHASGVMTGALIASGWAVYAASGLEPAYRYVLFTIAAGVAIALLVAGAQMVRAARTLPGAPAGQGAPRRRVWLWFCLNFLGEIILLNIAVNLLAAPDQQIFWIPAISAVVGLHFWPMAVFFRARSYWFVGGAMMAAAAVTTLLILYRPESAPALMHGEAFVNALILWIAVAAAAVAALKPGAVSRPAGR